MKSPDRASGRNLRKLAADLYPFFFLVMTLYLWATSAGHLPDGQATSENFSGEFYASETPRATLASNPNRKFLVN